MHLLVEFGLGFGLGLGLLFLGHNYKILVLRVNGWLLDAGFTH